MLSKHNSSSSLLRVMMIMKMMKKKRVSMGMVLRIGLWMLLLVLILVSLSSISKLNSTSTPHRQEGTIRKIKADIKWDLLSHKRNQSPWITPITCDRTALRYDLCSINGPAVVDPTTFTFFATGSTTLTQLPSIRKIRPYPRKYESYIMAQIREVTLTAGPPGPSCQVHHNSPALVFSARGYTGNVFHDFNDGFVPLFITVNTIFPSQDFVIVVSEASNWWSLKYANLLQEFSKHPIINIENDMSIHCFPFVKLGLISHGFMTINQTLIPNSKTLLHFRGLLDRVYGKDHFNMSNSDPPRVKPRLVLVSRNGANGRMIVNQEEVVWAMEEVGFEVVVFEPRGNTSMHEAYALVNSSQVMVGVHGAALTHSLFLQPGTVLIQVVPIGTDWAAGAFYGRIAEGINLEYMEYKIGVEESSLAEKYGKDSLVVKDPHELQKKGWPTEIMDLYLREQNVKLDMVRFMRCLKEAYKKAKKNMNKKV